MSDTHPAQQLSTDSIPRPPRPATAKARMRVLNEPNVRFWWMLAALVFASFVVATISGIRQWQNEAKVIASGPVVKAIGFNEGAKIKNRPLSISMTVYIEYEYQGKKYTSQGPLMATGEQYMAGIPFDIRLDPDDPSVWTNRREAASLHEKLIGSVITLFFGAICLVGGMFARYRYLAVWKNGGVYSAKVVEHRQMALAPRSVALKCAVRVEKRDYLVLVYVPLAGPVPAPGEPIQLISNDTGTRAIALSNYA